MHFDITWPLALLSIIGTIFNVKKRIVCFYLWMVGEFFWIAIDFSNGQYGRMFLDFVHLGMAVWGIYDWSKDNKQEVPHENRKNKNRKSKSRKI